VSTVDKKQSPVRPGLENPNWLPIGYPHIAQNMAIRGVRVAYRDRGDPNCELVRLDPGRPPDEQSNFFYYAWGPDFSMFTPWLEEEEQVRRKFVRQREVVARPKSGKRGRKPTADWKNRVAYHVGYIEGSGEEIPTAAKIAEWCGQTLGYAPDPSDINKFLKTLRD